VVVEKGMEHKREQFGGTMMQELQLLWLAKRHVLGQRNVSVYRDHEG